MLPVLSLCPYLDTISQGRSPKVQSSFPSPITVQCCKQRCIGTDIGLLGGFLHFGPWDELAQNHLPLPFRLTDIYITDVFFSWKPRGPSSSPGAAQHPPNPLHLLLHCRLLNRPPGLHLSWIFGDLYTFTKKNPRNSRWEVNR